MSDHTSRPHKAQRLLTINEAAEFFQVSTKTVRRWIAAGELRAHRLGRQWCISIHEVERFLSMRQIQRSTYFQ